VRGFSHISLALGLALSLTACAPITTTTTSSEVVTGRVERRGAPRIDKLAATLETSTDGLRVRVVEELACEAWEARLVKRTPTQNRRVNKAVLALEAAIGIAGLVTGGVWFLDARDETPDTELLLMPVFDRSEQRLISSATLGLGALGGIATIVDMIAAVDRPQPSVRVEEKVEGSARAVACGSHAAPSVVVGVRRLGEAQHFALGRTSADGEISVGWRELPAALFEGREVAGTAELVGNDTHMLGVIDLTPGRQAHAEAAWSALGEAATKEDLERFRSRFPGYRGDALAARLQAVAGTADSGALLVAAQQALGARDLVTARTAVAALKGRVPASVFETYAQSLAELERGARSGEALAAATNAVARAASPDADAAAIDRARKAIEDARTSGSDETKLVELEAKLAIAKKAVALAMTRDALTLPPEQAESKLAEAKVLAPTASEVTRAIERNRARLVRAARVAVDNLAKQRRYTEALGELARVEGITGPRDDLHRQRSSIEAAMRAAERAQEARERERANAEARAEAARQRAEAQESRRVAAQQAREEAQRAARERRELAQAEEQRRRDAKLREDEMRREREAAAASARRAAAEAEAAAKLEAARRQKEEQLRAKSIEVIASRASIAQDRKAPKVIEYQLAASFAAQDILARTPVPPTCRATISDLRARVPGAASAEPVAMRRVEMTCSDVALELVKSGERVWARCTNQTCAECTEMANAALAPFRVGKQPSTVVSACRSIAPAPQPPTGASPPPITSAPPAATAATSPSTTAGAASARAPAPATPPVVAAAAVTDGTTSTPAVRTSTGEGLTFTLAPPPKFAVNFAAGGFGSYISAGDGISLGGAGVEVSLQGVIGTSSFPSTQGGGWHGVRVDLFAQAQGGAIFVGEGAASEAGGFYVGRGGIGVGYSYLRLRDIDLDYKQRGIGVAATWRLSHQRMGAYFEAGDFTFTGVAHGPLLQLLFPTYAAHRGSVDYKFINLELTYWHPDDANGVPTAIGFDHFMIGGGGSF